MTELRFQLGPSKIQSEFEHRVLWSKLRSELIRVPSMDSLVKGTSRHGCFGSSKLNGTKGRFSQVDSNSQVEIHEVCPETLFLREAIIIAVDNRSIFSSTINWFGLVDRTMWTVSTGQTVTSICSLHLVKWISVESTLCSDLEAIKLSAWQIALMRSY